jgi:pyruvate dehydrogenase E1 component beta subunit
MAREIMFMSAIGEALNAEMARDASVFLIGEDVAGGTGTPGGPDAWGGIMGVTKGLHGRYPGRVIDTPISESALVGAGVGAAVAGMRPVVELMFIDFLGVCFDQIFNQAAKFRYMFGGKAKTPLVVRTLCGGKAQAAAQHSQMLTPIFTHIPGLKVVCPSSPYDAKGLLIQAIRDDDPVIFMEHKALLATKGDVPEESYAIPFGEANVLREGRDVTIVTYGLMVLMAMGVAQEMAKNGVQCEVIDLRTLSPLDEDTILESVENTGRLVVVDEAYPRCSIAADVSSLVAEKAFGSLKAPIAKVTAPHCPVPFAKALEDAFVPSPERIAAAVMQTVAYKG